MQITKPKDRVYILINSVIIWRNKDEECSKVTNNRT